jgi:hypothetical protein
MWVMEQGLLHTPQLEALLEERKVLAQVPGLVLESAERHMLL